MNVLADKTILVTGGGAGIGLGIVRCCVANGASVMVFEKDTTKRACVEALGAVFVEVDLADTSAVEQACALVPHLDGLVNNAGITIQKPLADLSLEEMDLLWQVNQRPMLLLPKLLTPKMPEGAAIVNIASNHAKASDVHYEAYAGTKGAIVAMTRALAWSMGRKGIRVNALAPGLTMTEMVQGVADSDPDLAARFGSWHASGRVNSVDDIGKAAVFLLSDASVAINGTEIIADQGMSARLGDIK